MRSNSYNIAENMTSTLQRKYSDFDFYHAQQLRKGSVFTNVCQELCLWGTLPPGRHPRGRHLLGRHPQADIPPYDGHCNGRYASYWNAFLLFLFVVCDCCHDNSSAPGHQREQEEGTMKRNIIFGPATPKIYCIDCDGIAENGDEVKMTS